MNEANQSHELPKRSNGGRFIAENLTDHPISQHVEAIRSKRLWIQARCVSRHLFLRENNLKKNKVIEKMSIDTGNFLQCKVKAELRDFSRAETKLFKALDNLCADTWGTLVQNDPHFFGEFVNRFLAKLQENCEGRSISMDQHTLRLRDEDEIAAQKFRSFA